MILSTPINKVLKVLTFNLPSGPVATGGTCVGQTAYCKTVCYAHKGNFTYPNVKAIHAHNLAATQSPDFIKAMIAQITPLQPRVLRIHSSGDFYSPQYLEAWLQIAAACPATQFYTYTRAWHRPEFATIMAQSLDQLNFSLFHSVDPSDTQAPLWDRISIISNTHSTCAKQTRGSNCLECKKCYSGKREIHVTFKRH